MTPNRWSEADLNTLAEIYPYYHSKEVVKILGHSLSAVNTKATELGIRKATTDQRRALSQLPDDVARAKARQLQAAAALPTAATILHRTRHPLPWRERKALSSLERTLYDCGYTIVRHHHRLEAYYDRETHRRPAIVEEHLTRLHGITFQPKIK